MAMQKELLQEVTDPPTIAVAELFTQVASLTTSLQSHNMELDHVLQMDTRRV